MVVTDDEITVCLFASGALEVEKGQTQSGVLPRRLQQGANRLALAALKHGEPPPTSVPDIWRWLHRPLSEWPLDLEPGMKEGVLFEDGVPTSWCQEWACEETDVEAELRETRLMNGVMDVCRDAGALSSYVAFRRLLIDSPVLTGRELLRRCSTRELTLLADAIRHAYEGPPLAYVNSEDTCHSCAHCGHLLRRTTREKWRCEDPFCRVQQRNGVSVGRTYRIVSDDPRVLKWGLRRFISAPGRAELRLVKRLCPLGVAVEMWPAFDAYDVRVVFPDGEVWACDVKDWANPWLLGRHLSTKTFPFAHDAPWNRAFWVFPDEKSQCRFDYRQAFVNTWRPGADTPNIDTVFESEFVTRVRRRMKALRGDEPNECSEVGDA